MMLELNSKPWVALALGAAVMLWLPRPAVAANGVAKRAAAKARFHDAKAAEHFNLGEFDEAAHHYELAYRAKPLAVFLYNIAQCYKRMPEPEDKRRALFFFESYLQNAPEAPNRADVEAEIAALKKQLAPEPPPASKPSLASEPPPAPGVDKPREVPSSQAALPLVAQQPRRESIAEPTPVWKRWWFWTAVAAVAAAGAVGIAVAAAPDGTRMPQGPEFNFEADFAPK